MGICEIFKGICFGSNWKYKFKFEERELGWIDVGVLSIDKVIKVMEDMR